MNKTIHLLHCSKDGYAVYVKRSDETETQVLPYSRYDIAMIIVNAYISIGYADKGIKRLGDLK